MMRDWLNWITVGLLVAMVLSHHPLDDVFLVLAILSVLASIYVGYHGEKP